MDKSYKYYSAGTRIYVSWFSFFSSPQTAMQVLHYFQQFSYYTSASNTSVDGSIA